MVAAVKQHIGVRKHIFGSLALVCIPLHQRHSLLELPCSDIIDPQRHNHQPLKLTGDSLYHAKRPLIQQYCLKIISPHGLSVCRLIQHIGIIGVCLERLIQHCQVPLALFLHFLWRQIVAVVNYFHWESDLLKGFSPLFLIFCLNLLMNCTLEKIIIFVVKPPDHVHRIRGDAPALHKAFHLNLAKRARILLHNPAQRRHINAVHILVTIQRKNPVI